MKNRILQLNYSSVILNPEELLDVPVGVLGIVKDKDDFPLEIFHVLMEEEAVFVGGLEELPTDDDLLRVN